METEQVILNNTNFEVSLNLKNEYYSYGLSWNSVVELNLSNTISNCFMQGNIILHDERNVIERKIDPNEDPNEGAKNPNEVKMFCFENNGTDKLTIYIRPQDTEDRKYNDNWILSGEFIVYDKEDYPFGIDDKNINLKFVDADYMKMIKTTPNWCTTTHGGGTGDQNLRKDIDRSMDTGSALLSLLKSNGFNVDGSNWSTGISNLFLSLSNNMNIYDGVQYIMERHADKETREICFLTKDYNTNQYALLPFSKFIVNAGNTQNSPGKWQLDHFYVSAVGHQPKIKLWKAPRLDEANYEYDIQSTLISYQFIDGGSTGVNLFDTPLVVTTHTNRNEFIIDSQITPELIEAFIHEKYIKNFYTKNGQMSSRYSDYANNYSLFNTSFVPFSVNDNVTHRNTRGKMLSIKLSTSSMINIESQGGSYRKVGRFFGFDRLDFSEDNFDHRLCGQWFVTAISHKFGPASYTNNITGIKMHTFKPDKVETVIMRE